MFKLSLNWVCLVILIFANGCSQKKLSERDRKLQDRQQKIDVKKNELLPLTGKYIGTLIGENEYLQNVKLFLEVKDIPESSGQGDPVLTPKIVGNLRFLYGSEQGHEYIDCSVVSAEFNKSTRQLTVIVTHKQFNEMILSGTVAEKRFIGAWNASSLGMRGTFRLDKESP